MISPTQDIFHSQSLLWVICSDYTDFRATHCRGDDQDAARFRLADLEEPFFLADELVVQIEWAVLQDLFGFLARYIVFGDMAGIRLVPIEFKQDGVARRSRVDCSYTAGTGQDVLHLTWLVVGPVG